MTLRNGTPARVARTEPLRELLGRCQQERRQPQKEEVLKHLIGRSAAMDGLRQRVAALAPAPVNLLVAGETGTGKELVATALHALGDRWQGPLIAVNCATLGPNLADSELFGHAKGAFTGAIVARNGLFKAADGGTLFLDEIGELPLEVQAKLLRAAETGRIRPVGQSEETEVDVRIIAATNRNVEQEIREGRLRRDLLRRLSGKITVPSLRERMEDLPLLVAHALDGYGKRTGTWICLDADALNLLMGMPLEGNVRELINMIETAAAIAVGQGRESITAELLEPEGRTGHTVRAQAEQPGGGSSRLPAPARLEASGTLVKPAAVAVERPAGGVLAWPAGLPTDTERWKREQLVHALAAVWVAQAGRNPWMGHMVEALTRLGVGETQARAVVGCTSSGSEKELILIVREAMIEGTLRMCGGNKTRAAEQLGMDRTTLVEVLGRSEKQHGNGVATGAVMASPEEPEAVLESLKERPFEAHLTRLKKVIQSRTGMPTTPANRLAGEWKGILETARSEKLVEALREHGGDLSRAARKLGISYERGLVWCKRQEKAGIDLRAMAKIMQKAHERGNV